MKAVIYNEYGGPEVLHVAEIAKPKPSDNEVLIRISAAEVTKGDCELRSFEFPVKWFSFGLRLVFGVFRPRKKILGGYFSGTVEEIGARVNKFSPGDEVFGASSLKLGAYAQYLALPEKYTIVHKPSNLSFEQAAAAPLGGLNALHFMRLADIQPGETLLVNGAGGSIGTFAVQIAKCMGAEVTAVDAAIKERMLLDIGADHFIDYGKQDFRKSGRRYDVIFDMVASSPLDESIAVLSSAGRYVTANPTFKKMLGAKKTYKKTGKKVIFAFAAEREDELQALKAMLEEERISPAVDRIFPMEQVVEAHRCVEAEQRLGIIVLKID